MYHPTTRVLAVLELLQSYPRLTGRELATRLEVDVRTARRYVEMLQDLGIPIEGERGRYGAYRLRPGYKLPPLMFTEDEALALTLGLIAARRLGLAATAPAVESALAKVDRVMPLAVAERVRAVEETLVLDVGHTGPAPKPRVVVTLGEAAQVGRRVWMRYRSARLEVTEREFDPYGLVYREGYWYATGYCHLRRGQRLFRLDRILETEPREGSFTRPPHFDPLKEVVDTIASIPGEWRVEVLLEASLEAVRRQVPPITVTLEDTPDGVLLRCYAESLPWMARVLSALGCAFVVHSPEELREALLRHADELREHAERR
ncbi:MAG: YafY family transcriptional regulator [Chloroflexota bacterium]|nr:YafY family transcriptional regulator [Chloroflexota bacterium]